MVEIAVLVFSFPCKDEEMAQRKKGAGLREMEKALLKAG